MSGDTNFIYVIGHLNRNGKFCAPVKVGISKNAQARLATIRTSCPAQIDIAFLFAAPSRETARVLECAFHSVMKKHRLRGEWFDLPPLVAIRFMCSNIRQCLSQWIGLEGEALDDALSFSGVPQAEFLVHAATERLGREGITDPRVLQ